MSTNHFVGGIDTRTDFTGLEIDDEELARRLQLEELRSGETKISEEKNLEWKGNESFLEENPAVKNLYETAYARADNSLAKEKPHQTVSADDFLQYKKKRRRRN